MLTVANKNRSKTYCPLQFSYNLCTIPRYLKIFPGIVSFFTHELYSCFVLSLCYLQQLSQILRFLYFPLKSFVRVNEMRKMQNWILGNSVVSNSYGITINKPLQKKFIGIAKSKTCNLRNPRTWLIEF